MDKTNSLKKYFSLLIGILVSTALFASAPDTLWTRTYGGAYDETGNSVQQTQDSGFIVVGETTPLGSNDCDIYLIKTNPSGDTLWTRTFGGTWDDCGYSVRQTFDGGFIITGETESFGAGYQDVYLIKTNSSGDTLWTRTFGGTYSDVGKSVQQTSDSGFIIAGTTIPFGANNCDIYLIKTNPSGDTLWTKTFGGNYEDYGYSVQQTTDGGFVIAGWTGSFGAGNRDAYLIKTNPSGDTLWTKTFGGTWDDYGYSVQQTSDGGFIIVGETTPNNYDVYLIKTNPSGDTLWTKTFGGTWGDCGYSVQQTQDNGFIIVGGTYFSGANVYLIKTNPSGDTLWSRTFGGTWYDCGYSVRQTSDGGFIIAGETESFGAGGSDVYLIRLGKETGVEEPSISDFGLGIAELKISENPITNFANISYAIPSQCKVELNVYDITGSCVKTLFDGEKGAGSYSINLNAKELKAGIYFVRLTTGTFKVTKKITVIR
jgi:hypothetical protein